jgi:hypothetical protein
MPNWIALLDAEYEQIGAEMANLIDRAAANRAKVDELMMEQNEKDTGVGQTPRGIDHWRDVVVQDLPFSLTVEGRHDPKQQTATGLSRPVERLPRGGQRNPHKGKKEGRHSKSRRKGRLQQGHFQRMRKNGEDGRS